MNKSRAFKSRFFTGSDIIFFSSDLSPLAHFVHQHRGVIGRNLLQVDIDSAEGADRVLSLSSLGRRLNSEIGKRPDGFRSTGESEQIGDEQYCCFVHH